MIGGVGSVDRSSVGGETCLGGAGGLADRGGASDLVDFALGLEAGARVGEVGRGIEVGVSEEAGRDRGGRVGRA